MLSDASLASSARHLACLARRKVRPISGSNNNKPGHTFLLPQQRRQKFDDGPEASPEKWSFVTDISGPMSREPCQI
ncbi:hypothetical protein PIB30_094364 [Stylosanthes scabra]|uniref:Uncharacterized protein n=1 Tax=Stylosanthes scabra TaxID=79078 RepID=A0ABU6RVD1_9FABA|nr:hypothetical protein [Stylosanthes scabra]